MAREKPFGEIKICPRCGTRNTATFPEEAQNLVQYGNRLKAFGVYLTNYQLVPYERTSELLRDLFSAADTPSPAVSVATLHHANQTCYERLEAVAQKIKEQIVSAPVVNFKNRSGKPSRRPGVWMRPPSESLNGKIAASSKKAIKKILHPSSPIQRRKEADRNKVLPRICSHLHFHGEKTRRQYP